MKRDEAIAVLRDEYKLLARARDYLESNGRTEQPPIRRTREAFEHLLYELDPFFDPTEVSSTL